MTVSSTTNRVTFAGNGVTTIFAFPYYFTALTDFVVTLTDNGTSAITTLSYPADFTVSGVLDAKNVYSSGGSITCSVAPAAGKTLTVVRSVVDTQSTDFTDNNVENAVDRNALVSQGILDKLSRSVTLKDGFTGTFDPSLPTTLPANAGLVVNPSGTGFTTAPAINPTAGTVTSVDVSMPAEFVAGGSPVTTSGTLTVTKATQAKNKVYAGPTSGADAQPAFRNLVASDIPSGVPVDQMSSGLAANGKVAVADGAGHVNWSSVGSGTVTSVGMTVPSIMSVSGSPVTGSGSLDVTLNSETKNTVLAAPNGVDGTPTFRPLTGSDLPAFAGVGTSGAVPTSADPSKYLKGDGTWASVPAGTVTSVDLTMPSEFSVSGDPVTGAGTLAVSKSNQAANQVFAGPVNGIPDVPGFRQLVALDIPLMVGASNSSSGVRGAVPPANAGQQSLFLRADGTWQAAAGGGGGGVTIYNLITDLPGGASDGTLAVVIQNKSVYMYSAALSAWKIVSFIGSSNTNQIAAFDATGNLIGIIGTANQILGTNAAGTSQEFKTISGTANQVSVTHGVGTVTLSTPQNIDSGASPTFVGEILTGLTASRLVATDGSKNLVSDKPSTFVLGTANQITVTDSGNGTATLSAPQNLDTGANVTFNQVTAALVGNASTSTKLAATKKINGVAFDGSADITIPSELPYIVAGGTADVLTATFAPAITALVDGMIISVGSTAANATTTPTLNVNGLGAKTITKGNGVALLAGDIPATDYHMLLSYQGGTNTWILLNPNTVQYATNAASATTATSAGSITGNLTGDITSVGMATTYNNAVPLNKGGTGATSVTTVPAATAFAGWDANKNLSANNQIDAFTTTATAAGTTTLLVGSTRTQVFTGATTQTVLLPVVTTLVNGFQFKIINQSSGVVTVQSSGANAIQAMAANHELNLTCVNTAGGTGTASWVWTYGPIASAALPIAIGGTAKTAVTTAAAASSWAGWDANKNLSTNNLLEAYTTTATAAGTTTLVVGSTFLQYFTGTTTQTCVLPVATTLVNGQQFQIVNNSTGIVTVQSSGANVLAAMPSNSSLLVTCINTAGGTGTASWNWGLTTNASQLNKNLMTNGNDFETGLVNGWTGTGCATITNGLPVTVGTGGTAFTSANGGRAVGGTTTAPAVATSGIDGIYSLNLATSGAGTIGDGYISQSIPISIGYQAKALTVAFKYKVVTGTPVMAGTSSNTYACAVYDVTNNAWIGMAGNFNFVQSSGVGDFVGTFQTASNTAAIQIFVYSPVAPAAASSLLLDNFYVGQQVTQKGPAVSDWVAYTPTTTGMGTISPSTNFAQWRRVGDSIQVEASFTTGTLTASLASVSLPSGLSLDASKIIAANTTSNPGEEFGSWNQAFGTDLLGKMVTATGTSTSLLYFGGNKSQSALQLTPQIANGGLFNGTVLTSVRFQVPISGWSSNSVQSSDTDTRVVSFYGQKNATQAVTADVTNIATNVTVRDSHSAWTGSTYVVPVSGDYVCTIATGDSAAGNPRIDLYKNASLYQILTNSTANGVIGVATVCIPFVAGDIISFRSHSSLTLNASGYVSVYRLSGPAVIAASESVAAKYNSSTTTLTNVTYVNAVMTVKEFDTHNAYNTSTGVFTVPVAGTYRISGSFYISANGGYTGNTSLQMAVSKNAGGTYSSMGAVYFGVTVTQKILFCGTSLMKCNAGDTLAVVGYNDNLGGTTLASDTVKTWASFERIGN